MENFIIISGDSLDKLAEVCASNDYSYACTSRSILLVLGTNFILSGILTIFLGHQNHRLLTAVICSIIGIISIVIWVVLKRKTSYKNFLEKRQKQMNELAYKCRVNAEIALMEHDIIAYNIS